MSRLSGVGYWLSGNFRMVRLFICLTLFAVAGFTAVAQEVTPAAPVDPVAAALDALRAGQIQAAEAQLASIPNPAARFFVQACIERAKGDFKSAIQTVGELIVQYPNDAEWTAKGELLSVMLYMDLGMLDSADATARQMQQLYAGMDIAKQADVLRARIESSAAKPE
jgi:hypothetical protein